MLADFFTKPLQGQLFLKFRDVLLGYKHVRELQKIYDATPSPEERVGSKVLESVVPPQQCGNMSTGTGTTYTDTGTSYYTGTGTSYTGTDQDGLGAWSLVRARRNRRSAGTGTSTGTSLMYTGTDTGNRCTINNNGFVRKVHNFTNNPSNK
jgi:hypothetical protein